MDRPPTRRHVAAALAVALVAVAAHQPALRIGWIFDDAALLDDARVQDLSGWPDLLEGGLFSGVRDYGGYYRPLTSLSLAAEAALGWTAPWQRHLTNVLLHGLVALAAALLLARLLRRPEDPRPGGDGVALGAALIFAVHPLTVDAVAPVTGRGDLLAAVLLLGSWASFDRRRTAVVAGRGRAAGAGWLGGACALAAGAVLAKESAAVLPLLAAAGERLRRRPGSRPGPAVDLTVLVLAVGACLGLRTAVLGGFLEPGLPSPLDTPLAGASLGQRLLGAPAAWLLAARWLAIPWPLPTDLSAGAMTLPAAATDPRVVCGWALAAVCAALAVRALRRRQPAALGSAILLGGYLPAANLLFTAPVLLAPRLLYLPCLGFALLLCLGLRTAARRRRVRVALALLVVGIAAVLLGLTRAQLTHYADGEAIWEHACRSTAGSAKAWYNLGNVRLRHGDVAAAAAAYAEATDRVEGFALAWSNLGITRLRLGKEEAAAAALRRAVALDPGLAQAHAGLAAIALRRADVPEARRRLRQSLLRDPAQPDAATLRGLLRQLEEAPGAGPPS